MQTIALYTQYLILLFQLVMLNITKKGKSMKFTKKLMLMAFVMATSTNLFCAAKVTFKNNLDVQVTLTGPRGSKPVAAHASTTIQPKMNPVQYSIKADGFPTFKGQAEGGKNYSIGCKSDENGHSVIVVS